MSDKQFCASVHCMDGRIQKPIIEFIQQNYGYKYVDSITDPGPNKILAEGNDNPLSKSILARLDISVKKHKGDLIFVSGHFDCAGNPTEKETQILQIEKSVEFLRTHYPNVEIVKLWIDKNWQVSVL